LAQAGRAANTRLLSEFGAKDPSEVKAQLAELAELKKASMTEAEKRQAEIDALKPKAERAERLGTLTNKIVGDLFDALPEAQRTAIDKVANGDPEQRWQLMQLIRDASPAGATPESPKPPASTTPAGAPPPPASPAAPETPYQVWQRKTKEDPIGAGIFYAANALAIEKSMPAPTP